MNTDKGDGERFNTETKSKDLHRGHRGKAEKNLRKIEAFTAAQRHRARRARSKKRREILHPLRGFRMTARGGMMREVRDDIKGARLKKQAAATTSTTMLVWQQSRRTARSGCATRWKATG